MNTQITPTEIKDAVKLLLEASAYTPNGNALSVILAEQLIGDHRTNQQSFIRTLVEGLRLYGDRCGADLRNEASVKWAKDVTEDAGPFPYI